jgi:hypothetical protein
LRWDGGIMLSLISPLEHEAAIKELQTARNKTWRIMLIAYGDDSSDESKQRVFSAAVVLGTQEEWDKFYVEWKVRNGDRPFHATDCDSDGGDFKHTRHEDNKKLYADNVNLLVNSQMMGAAVSMSIPDYLAVFPFAPPGEWPYYLCFCEAIMHAATISRLSVPTQRVNITFDSNHDRGYNATELYRFIVDNSLDTSILDDTISFGSSRKIIGLQAADIIARESMKALDNLIGPKQRSPRQSLVALRRSNRFSFICHDRTKLEERRLQTDKIHADPESAKQYQEWLRNNNIADSIQNRLRFVMKVMK